MARLLLVVLASLLASGLGWALRATPYLDTLEATLGSRAASLAGARDKTAKKQLRAAEKSLHSPRRSRGRPPAPQGREGARTQSKLKKRLSLLPG